MKNTLDVDHTVQIWKDDSQFVTHTMPLDIMSCGDVYAGFGGRSVLRAVR